MAMWLKDNLEDIWPDVAGADLTYATRMVERAEKIIQTRFPTLEMRVKDGQLDPAVVAGVVEDMVTRVLDRRSRGGLDKLSYPEVQMEWSDSGGLGSGSLLYLTTDELVLLSPPVSEGAFSIRPRRSSPPHYGERQRWYRW